MRASIEYLPQESFLASVEIEDIGNVSLVLYNDTGFEWYLVTTTSLGWTKVYMFGPLLPDVNILAIKSFNFSYCEIEYRESKLINMIEKFIQDPRKNITQVFEIEKRNVFERYRNLNIGEQYVCEDEDTN